MSFNMQNNIIIWKIPDQQLFDIFLGIVYSLLLDFCSIVSTPVILCMSCQMKALQEENLSKDTELQKLGALLEESSRYKAKVSYCMCYITKVC